MLILWPRVFGRTFCKSWAVADTHLVQMKWDIALHMSETPSEMSPRYWLFTFGAVKVTRVLN